MPDTPAAAQSRNSSLLKWLWLTVLVIVLDLASKAIVSSHFSLYETRMVIPGWFNLTLAHNTGAAFSFLANESGWQRWFFSLIALIVSTVILLWITRLRANERWTAVALTLILGGALGNLWDRLTLGYVVDFLDFYYQYQGSDGLPRSWHFPAFNVADTAISIGAAILIIDTFMHKREE